MADNRARAISFVVLVGGTLALGLLAGVYGTDVESAWYRGLELPDPYPPSIVFSAVWTALYVMMGVAAWRVWVTQDLPAQSPEIRLYGLQLALNILWTFIFFQGQNPGAALLEITVLLVVLAYTLVRFYRYDRVAGWLLVPYFAWVIFATGLNAAIWWLNR